ncbi:MAG: SGNH/GDSL hydrolase family protein [Planctomycetota bacterium]
MKTIKITRDYIQGAVSAERIDGALYPCRLPVQKRHLFPAPDDSLMIKAFRTSGVRLRMETDAEALTLRFAPLEPPKKFLTSGHAFDIVIDNEIVQTSFSPERGEEVVFDKIGAGRRVVELWLPPGSSVGLKDIEVADSVFLRPLPDRRPLWVTWGSSITHCVRAGSAARVWPAIVARKHNLNLLSLGFGGDCHLDPMVAMVIRDLPASYISMKLGINTVSRSLCNRTYQALVAAAVAIVREKHSHTPLALISPIANPPRENTPTPTGYTLEEMRSNMKNVHASFAAAGDMNLYYISGMDLFGIDDIEKYADDLLHPNAEGIDLQAERFCQQVIPYLLGEC